MFPYRIDSEDRISCIHDDTHIDVPVHGDSNLLQYPYITTKLLDRGKNNYESALAFRLMVDITTNVTFLPCYGCTVESCGMNAVERHVNIDHEAKIIRCSDDVCPTKFMGCEFTKTGKPDICPFKETFFDANFVSGTYMWTTMNISSLQYSMPIGCATNMSKGLRDQWYDGVLGLGPTSKFWTNDLDSWSLSLSTSGFFGGNLSFYFKPSEIGEHIVWIDLRNRINEDSQTQSTPNNHDSFYRVLLKSDEPVVIGNTTIKHTLDTELGAVINTKSPATLVPSELFLPMRERLQEFCRLNNNCGGNKAVQENPHSLGCYDLALSGLVEKRKDRVILSDKVSNTFPEFNFLLPGKNKAGALLEYNFTISPQNYLLHQSEEVFCIGFINDVGSTFSGDMVFGLNVLRGMTLTFDLSGDTNVARRVAFQPFDSSNLISKFQEINEDILARQAGKLDLTSFLGGCFAGLVIMLTFLCFFHYLFNAYRSRRFSKGRSKRTASASKSKDPVGNSSLFSFPSMELDSESIPSAYNSDDDMISVRKPHCKYSD